jgi:BirA family biotin operon repressor/biotin-[acetyl-CoA-carboxylase] ligase
MTIPLSLPTIRALLAEDIPIELFDTIPSTNDYLLAQKKIATAVCLAEQQSKGKGRLGREWHSPHGENIYLSYRCHLPKAMGEIGNLSVQVGEVVCRVLNQFGIKDGLTVKWPNDVLFEGKKLAGILIEVQPSAENSSHVVIGIGLNVNLMSDENNNISQPWTSMQAIVGGLLNRNHIIASLISALIAEAQKFDNSAL